MSKFRSFKRVERQAQDEGEENGDDVPECHEDDMVHHGGAVLQRDIQHEVEILVQLVPTVEPSDADHLEDCNPQYRHASAIVVHDLENIGP